MKKTISIIGGGPAALLLAAHLDSEKYSVNLYERNTALGRKLLVAGKGGFNLTHSEPLEQFIERYTPSSLLQKPLNAFSNNHLIEWLKNIGIPTLIGSSKRVYPIDGITPIEVLKAITVQLSANKVNIYTKHKWTGWNEKSHLLFNSSLEVKSDYTVFALGGSSWKNTGSDGSWKGLFQGKEIETQAFQPSNCAYKVKWDSNFINKYEGTPLKNIAVSCNNKYQKGELVISQFGLEGNAIYALSPEIRSQLNSAQKASIFIDLKPSVSTESLRIKFENSLFKNTSEILRREFKLSANQVALLKLAVSKEDFLNPDILVSKVKRLPIIIEGLSPLDEAISTVGGIGLNAIDSNFELLKLKHHYCIGEMLDWDAPTGGYLLQACFSMGVFLAKHLNGLQ